MVVDVSKIKELRDIPGMTPGVASQLENVRVRTLKDFESADLEELFVTMRDISFPALRKLQSYARSALLVNSPRPAKLFVAAVDIAVESVQPFFDVKPGETVNFWWKTDAELKRMVEEGIIAPMDADLHLLVDEDWIPDAVRKALAFGGVYTLEKLAADAPCSAPGVEMPCSLWLTRSNERNNMDPAAAQQLILRAQQELAAYSAPKGGEA